MSYCSMFTSSEILLQYFKRWQSHSAVLKAMEKLFLLLWGVRELKSKASGKKQWMRAQNAKPSAQLLEKFSTFTFWGWTLFFRILLKTITWGVILYLILFSMIYSMSECIDKYIEKQLVCPFVAVFTESTPIYLLSHLSEVPRSKSAWRQT